MMNMTDGLSAVCHAQRPTVAAVCTWPKTKTKFEFQRPAWHGRDLHKHRDGKTAPFARLCLGAMRFAGLSRTSLAGNGAKSSFVNRSSMKTWLPKCRLTVPTIFEAAYYPTGDFMPLACEFDGVRSEHTPTTVDVIESAVPWKTPLGPPCPAARRGKPRKAVRLINPALGPSPAKVRNAPRQT